MTDKEMEDYLKKMKEFTNIITKEESMELLVKAGICTTDGNLKEHYGGKKENKMTDKDLLTGALLNVEYDFIKTIDSLLVIEKIIDALKVEVIALRGKCGLHRRKVNFLLK